MDAVSGQRCGSMAGRCQLAAVTRRELDILRKGDSFTEKDGHEDEYDSDIRIGV